MVQLSGILLKRDRFHDDLLDGASDTELLLKSWLRLRQKAIRLWGSEAVSAMSGRARAARPAIVLSECEDCRRLAERVDRMAAILDEIRQGALPNGTEFLGSSRVTTGMTFEVSSCLMTFSMCGSIELLAAPPSAFVRPRKRQSSWYVMSLPRRTGRANHTEAARRTTIASRLFHQNP